MKKFFVALLAVVLMMAGFNLTAEAQTEAEYGFTVAADGKTKTENATLSSLLTKYADSTSEVTIIAPYGVKDITLGTSATIGENVTLVLPCTQGQTSVDKSAVNPDLTDGKDQTLVSSLVINNNAKLTVKGALIVSGQTGKGGEVHNVVTGNYGEVKVESGASIVVANGGEFHNYGYVTGAGKMTAKNGAEIKDLYQIARFVGGGQMLALFGLDGESSSAALSQFMKSGMPVDSYPFPLPEAGSGNIAIQTKFEDGSKLVGTAKIYANELENYAEAEILGDGGLYVQDGGYITKKSTLSADRFTTLNKEVYQFSGNCSLGSTTVAINLLDIFSMDLTSERFVYSISGNTTLKVAKGGTLSVKHAFRFMPGSELEVKAGGTLVLNEAPANGTFGATAKIGEIIEAVVTGTSSTGYLAFVESARGTYASGSEPAKLVVNGTVDLGTNGYVFGLNENTLEVGSTGKVEMGCGHTQAVTEMEIPEMFDEAGVLAVNQSVKVSANWDYIETVAAEGHNFAKWKVSESGLTHYATCKDCKEKVKASVTAKNNGDGTHTVSCGNSACTVGTKTVKCTMKDGVVKKEATCTKAGIQEGKCTVCKKTFEQKISAPGHKYKTTITKATLTKNGKKTIKCTTCGYVASKSGPIYMPKTMTLSTTKYTYTGDVRKPAVTVKDSKGNTLKNGTDYTVTYESGRKNVDRYTVTIKFKGNYSGEKKLYFYIVPSRTSKIATTSTRTTIKSEWKKVTGATGYKVELLSAKGKVLKTGYTKTTAYTFKELAKVTNYKIRVSAFVKIGDKNYYAKNSTTVTTSTAPAAPTLKATAGSKRANLSWNKITCTGYEITYDTNSKFSSPDGKVTVAKNSTVKKSVTGLKKGKTYYFKMRSYKTVDGVKVYSSYSKVVKVTVK